MANTSASEPLHQQHQHPPSKSSHDSLRKQNPLKMDSNVLARALQERKNQFVPMTRRTTIPFDSLQFAVMSDMRSRKNVRFSMPMASREMIDTSTGVRRNQEDPPPKKRKMQRRCSKTPAMLSSFSAIAGLSADLATQPKKTPLSVLPCLSKPTVSSSNSSWMADSGISIAHQLVEEIKKREAERDALKNLLDQRQSPSLSNEQC
mmetsp:Transcript_46786/g.69579  ORF Transcript_46786/g.69579 Transcript_46786/m.69579 type:complete len:205 (-) Transcript_46786:42-656(-)|eukprot:CAMPEP_0194029764 /NCGR_PEP_ID=MMETSP0009_2-20130614/3419_1 /TAXON_ID=210454 /ORGANISM="Grammatophora oceanica, Strain CCMP 410" /LENGTH=204 /DNA_ID=CAMNT_0038669533 /DNA_START=41 /DNA_END=655 /DNA_ORIENTATION=+